jgi:alpha-1,3/alpha-1,6-mannosyltransferase
MRAPVLFYCHFPDQLLATRGGGGGGGGGSAVTRALRAAASTLRSLYRTPLDALEQATTGAADCLFVNSAFTARVFASTFPRVAAARPPPRVLYPAAAIPSDADLAAAARTAAAVLPPAVVALTEGGRPLFVSINRFERKKGLPLALRALAELKATRKGADPLPALVFAGGYDVRLPENVAVLDELKTEARSLGVAAAVAYLPSFSDPQRAALLALATAVVYTPQNEHFGIVPVEAGAAGVPVVACDSGGPTESILHGQTGFLCAPTPAAFAAALAGLAEDEGAVRRVGAAARGRVRAQFSRGAFGDALEGAVVDLVRKGRGRW